MNPYTAVEEFERELAAYTGAPYAVSCTSCTVALQMALMWFKTQKNNPEVAVSIPRRTYVGVGHAVVNSGHKIRFRDEDWSGAYRLAPYPVIDSARWIYKRMYVPGTIMALSFHWTKQLSVGSGGALILNDPIMTDWLRRVRFDGRQAGVAPRDDIFDVPGLHCYMSPMTAAEALTRLAVLPAQNDPLPNSDYADLSLSPYFQSHQIGAKKVA